MAEPIACCCELDDGDCDHYRRGRLGNTTPGLVGLNRQGRCFELAFNYVFGLPDDGVQLVHGTIGVGEGAIKHGWVLESDGWVWEPVNDAWVHSEEASFESKLHGQGVQKFPPSYVTAKANAGELIGEYNPVPQDPPALGSDAASNH